MVNLLWKTVWSFPRKLKRELAYDPAISVVGTYIEELKQTKPCTQMYCQKVEISIRHQFRSIFTKFRREKFS